MRKPAKQHTNVIAQLAPLLTEAVWLRLSCCRLVTALQQRCFTSMFPGIDSTMGHVPHCKILTQVKVFRALYLVTAIAAWRCEVLLTLQARRYCRLPVAVLSICEEKDNNSQHGENKTTQSAQERLRDEFVSFC